MKPAVSIITKRVDYLDCYYLIIPDIAAGLPDRFTVYVLPTSGGVQQKNNGDKRVKIIGRELDLPYSRRLVREHHRKHLLKMKKERNKVLRAQMTEFLYRNNRR